MNEIEQAQPESPPATPEQATEFIDAYLAKNGLAIGMVAVGVVTGDDSSIMNFFGAGTHRPTIRIFKQQPS